MRSLQGKVAVRRFVPLCAVAVVVSVSGCGGGSGSAGVAASWWSFSSTADRLAGDVSSVSVVPVGPLPVDRLDRFSTSAPPVKVSGVVADAAASVASADPIAVPAPQVVQVPAPVPAPEPASAVAPAPADPCSLEAMVAVVAGLLAPFGVPVPTVAVGARSFYQPGVGVTLEPCARKDVVAHELGHHVMQLANGSFDAHVADVAANFCPGGAGPDGRCVSGWIRGSEMYPGIEHAAHCVGHALAGYGAYTKCPEPALLALARERISQAA